MRSQKSVSSLERVCVFCRHSLLGESGHARTFAQRHQRRAFSASGASSALSGAGAFGSLGAARKADPAAATTPPQESRPQQPVDLTAFKRKEESDGDGAAKPPGKKDVQQSRPQNQSQANRASNDRRQHRYGQGLGKKGQQSPGSTGFRLHIDRGDGTGDKRTNRGNTNNRYGPRREEQYPRASSINHESKDNSGNTVTGAGQKQEQTDTSRSEKPVSDNSSNRLLGSSSGQTSTDTPRQQSSERSNMSAPKFGGLGGQTATIPQQFEHHKSADAGLQFGWRKGNFDSDTTQSWQQRREDNGGLQFGRRRDHDNVDARQAGQRREDHGSSWQSGPRDRSFNQRRSDYVGAGKQYPSQRETSNSYHFGKEGRFDDRSSRAAFGQSLNSRLSAGVTEGTSTATRGSISHRTSSPVSPTTTSTWNTNPEGPAREEQEQRQQVSHPIRNRNIEEDAEDRAAKKKLASIMSRVARGDREERVKQNNKKGNSGRSRYDDEDEMDEELLIGKRLAKDKRKAERARQQAQRDQEEAEKKLRVYIPPYITVNNLATTLGVRFEDFQNKLEDLGYERFAPNHMMTGEDAALVAEEYGLKPTVDKQAKDLIAAPWPEDTSTLPARPPVVTIMGHVDHGKTTILDYLRKSSIVAGEHGGITQHIGAFTVALSSGKTITWLDTPGHAAFLSMRQRGANMTDVVVLVVAADDGVMPQTQEAIKHAKNSKVPIIVAINKIDKGDANVDRVKQDLSRNDVDIEDYGGEVQVVAVSGRTGQGIEKLEEAIVTLSEILDHRAPTEGPAEGWVIEASTKSHGRVATVLIKRGTVRVGSILVAGKTWARVRTLRNEGGSILETAHPGVAVEVDGWRELPEPGDEVLNAESEQFATAVVDTRVATEEQNQLARDLDTMNANRQVAREEALARKLRQEVAAEERGMSLRYFRRNALSKQMDAKESGKKLVQGAFNEDASEFGFQQLHLVVKADVTGSVEAVVNMVAALGNNLVRPNVIRAAAGAISESDIELAVAANAPILAFNVDTDSRIRAMADQAGVEIIEHRVIYHITDEINERMLDMLPDKVTQRVTGEAEILQQFEIKLKAQQKLLVAGCRVRNGLVTKGSKVRVLRGGQAEPVYDGKIGTLRNNKASVDAMKKDTECGMSFDDWSEFKVGDKIQCYEEQRERPTL